MTRIHKPVLVKSLMFISMVSAGLVFSGCQPAAENTQVVKPVFFPKPPDKPRLQFLKSFSGPEDVGVEGPSAFERFVVGEPEMTEGITKPYGVAIFDGKLYVCDVGKRMVHVLDLKNRTFAYLTKDRRLMNPVNICIDDNGAKYVADPTAGSVFVFDKNDKLSAVLGKELKISPIDVVVRASRVYVTDFDRNQIVVFDKTTGKEIVRIGKKSEVVAGQQEPLRQLAPGEFSLISDLALDQEGNIYVTDKAGARITEFDNNGAFKRTIGRMGRNIDEFARPKGIAIDKEDRIWVVDASAEVAKIYDQQAQLLLFFGLPGNEPGMMNLPAKIALDYDNVELFKQYAVEGANIEFLVLVSNQYGLNKISVYGFGSFPGQETEIEKAKKLALEAGPEKNLEGQVIKPPPSLKTELERADSQQQRRKEEIAKLYQRSMVFYRAGQPQEAREGFVKVLDSGLIPARMAKTIEAYVADIDNALAKAGQKSEKETAKIYYRSMTLYRAGQLERARPGFVQVLESNLIPAEMKKTIEHYLADIDNTLAKKRSNSH